MPMSFVVAYVHPCDGFRSGRSATTAAECYNLCKEKPCNTWAFGNELCFLDVEEVPNSNSEAILVISGTFDSVLPGIVPLRWGPTHSSAAA